MGKIFDIRERSVTIERMDADELNERVCREGSREMCKKAEE